MRIKIQNRNVILILVLVLQLISSTIFAQVPQKMSYQAVIRDASKALVTNKTIGMRIRIAQGTQSGSIVYTETFTPTTNTNGLVSLEIGGAAGFSSISWANGPYFILTDADLTGGTNYTISGYSQLVSVPYALHAKTAESITGSLTIPSGVTLPSPVSPTGSFYYKTDSDILYVSNGTVWLPVSTHGSTPSGTTFPVPTNPGDVFFNTANKNFYYWDGTTWKLVSNIPSGTTLPTAASSVVGDPFFKTDTNILYIFNGTSWNPINGLSSTLAEGSLFVGNAANVATPTTKVNIPLSGFGAPTADVSLGNKNITFLADPLIPTDAANKRYVDSKVSTNLNGPALPAVAGTAGNTFFNTTDKVFYISDGSKWLPVATDGSTPSGPTFPTLPAPGDVFYNTATSNYYYYDGTSWKIASSIPTGTSLPLTGVSGDPFFKSDTNTLYIYSNGAWTVAGLSNILANGSFYVGNASNIATATTKTSIPLSGFGAPTTSVSMGSQKLTNVATPTADPDAANKAYVDSKYSTTPSGPTLPAVPGAAGNTFFNTTSNVLYISDGTTWLAVTTDGSTPSGPTFPPSPSPGDVFYNTANNNYYYYDGTSWKITSSIPTGTTLPLTGIPGDPFFKTDTNTLYVYNNGVWAVAGLSNTLANGSFFVGNASNVATATTKTSIPLSGFGVPTTDVSMGTQKLTNLLTPTAGPDAANKAYVDAKTATTPTGPTNPPAAGASVGDVFYNTSTKSFYYFDGTDWKLISGVPTGTTLPPTGNPGDTFYNSTTNTLYVYNNGTWNSTKVQANWTENVVTADDYIKNKPTRVSQFTNDAGYLTSLGVPAAETDPIWNLAKGNYYTSAELSSYFPGSALVHWKNITNTPTTLLGYGITDAASSNHNHAIDGLSNVTITGKANNDILQWDNVSGKWVNKPLAVAVVQAETDPVVSAINGIVKSDGTNITNAVAGTDYVTPNSAIAGATKTKITYDSKGLVTAGADATTADIAPTANRQYVNTAQLTVINNTTNTNTGDQTAIQVAVTPTGNISSTNVQNALVELQGDINTINTSSHAAVTLGTTNGLALTGQQLSLGAATPALPGAMSAADKAKLDGIAAGAKVNVQADWNQTTITADDYIKNKPVNVGSFNNNVGYLTAGTLGAAESDPIWNLAKSNYYTKTELSTNFAGSAAVEWLNIINTPFNITGIAGGDLLRYNAITSKFEKFTPNYLTSTTLPAAETDPVVAKIKGIVKSDGTTISGAMAGTDYVDPTTTLTINGTTHDLSTDRSFNVGTVTSVSATGPISVTNGTTTPNISISQAGAAANGYLTSADWIAFNNKQAELGFTPENIANKSTLVTLGNSNTLYPTQNAVKTYVDNSITASTIPDATTLTKGKVQLAGDLAGTAAAPTVPGLALKEPTVLPGTTSQYYRGDKTWQTLDKSAVGLGNVDNTTDLNKPISTATSAALALKEDVSNKSTSTTLGNSNSLYPTQNAVKSYVDNQITTNATPDATTLSKGKVQLAGDLGGAAATPSVLKINGATLGTTTAADGNILIADGTKWESQTLSGDVNITKAGVATIQTNAVTTSKITDSNVTASKLTAGGGTAGRVAVADATGAVTYGNIPSGSVNGANLTSTDINVTGGTGATLTAASLAIADNAITNVKMADNAIGTAELQSNAVTAIKIADANVTTSKIADANVTSGKLTAGVGTAGRVAVANAAGVVTYGNIPSGSVNGANLTSTDITVTGGTGATLTTATLAIADNAITNAKMADNAIGTAELQNNAVTTSKITDANVTAAKLTAGAGTVGRVAVVTDITGTVTYGNVPSGSVTGKDLTSTDIVVTNGTGATLTSASLAIADNAITNAKMADNAIGTVELTDDAVTTPKIADANITTNKIANANVTTVKIADLNVTAGKLTAGAGTDGRVALANAAGAVTYGNIPSSSVNGANLTSTDLVVTGGTGSTLVPASLAIADGAVTTSKIANGTIKNEDLNKTDIQISGFANATANVSLGDGTTNFKITNLAAPTNPTDAVNKKYVDEAVNVPGKLYKGTIADNLTAFTALDWATINTVPNTVGTSIPSTICTLATTPSTWTWIAFPKAWGAQNFFFKYIPADIIPAVPAVVYSVFDGFEKRVVTSSAGVDYQVWIFKTTPNVNVDLIVNN